MTKDEYKLKRAEIEKQMRCLTTERTALDREYALTLTDIRVGDKIEYGDNKRYCGIVEDIALRIGSPKYVVRRIKKDGSVSGLLTDVFPYHNPKKIEQ